MEKSIYIMSLEASDIYNHNNRSMNIKKKYNGMIPFSLESLKLLENGLKTKYIERRDKYISDDIINVKFKSGVKSADEMLDIVTKKISSESDEEYVESLIKFKEELEYHSSKSESDDQWDKVGLSELREDLYNNGFKIEFYNKKTDKTKVIEYVVYKRSSAKSRTGQCLFIKKELYKKMISWSRMYLPFKNNQDIDLAGLLAYESLVGSTIESLIKIDPYKILMVDDVESNFKNKANVVTTNEETGMLDSFYKEDADIVNSLFDGESLLDSKYFTNDKSMLLLRNHMFKSASFNCNIQEFLKDHTPNNVKYEEWKLKDLFGNEIAAKDVDMICTPSSLKALKFAKVLPSKTESEMWDYWRNLVLEEGCIFGVCKSEKKSKITYKVDELPLQQTSYQMINCLPADYNDIEELAKVEVSYLKKLRSDNDFLVNEIRKEIDITNSNEVICDLYEMNNELADTSVFRNFKYRFMNKKRNHAKRGKLKVPGDYCVLLGNPIELLFHALGKFNLDTFEPVLKNNEVHCKMFDYDSKLVGFRNPNTSPSNILLVENVKNDYIDKYLNLTKNIVVVNAINFPIQDILSGCDYDSDTLLLSNNDKLVEIAERCVNKYYPCINNIQGDKKKYKLNKHDHFLIDDQLSKSQKNIGRVVNLGQFAMSVYWDLINKGMKSDKTEGLLKKVDVMTILSGIAIDMAKKFYAIDIDEEIKFVSNNEMLKEYTNKPLFWTTVSVNPDIKNKVEEYQCPMDFLISSLDSQRDNSRGGKVIPFEMLINDDSIKNINAKQMDNVINLLDEYISNIKRIQSQKYNEEYVVELTELEEEVSIKLSKWKLKSSTIAIILYKICNESEEKLLKLLKIIHKNHPIELEKAIKSMKK